MAPAGPRFLYLHGFASGPGSTKGVALAERFAARGRTLERLDLRLPSLAQLRLSAMIAEVKRRIGGPGDRAVLIGSSLGGLTACRVAEEDPRVCGLFLLAPAFRIAERWQARLGPRFEEWRASGWLEVDDYATKRRAEVSFGFFEELELLDARGGGWPDVRVPTRILHGRGDETVDVALSRAFAADRPQVELTELDDGHELVASLPRIGEELERFLRPYGG